MRKTYKFQRLLIFIVLFFAACGGAGGVNDAGSSEEEVPATAPQSACDKPYFPIRVGSTWTYLASSGDTFSWTITAVEGDLEYAEATMEGVYDTSEGTLNELILIECGRDGLLALNFFFTNIPEFHVLEVTNEGYGWYPPTGSLTAGSTWDYATSLTAEMVGMEGATATVSFDRVYTNQGLEDVEVTAGSFNALKVSSDATMDLIIGGIDMPQSTFAEQLWWGEGVGIVKNESSGDEGMTTTMELVSYSIP